MIKSIRLTRFKQFKDTEVYLQPFSVLMGENNAGKTTVLQALWLALTGLHQGKLVSVDWKTGQTRISGVGHPMYDVPFAPQGDYSGMFYNRISREGQTYDENSGAILSLTDTKGNCLRLHFRELFRNLNVKLLSQAQDLRGPELQNYAPLYISGFAGVRVQEERLFPAMMEAKAAGGNADAIVRNILLDLKLQSPEKFHDLEQLMELQFGFRISELRFRENDERYVCSEYEESTREDSVSLELGSAGSGVLQILQIAAIILRYCPERTRVVLIDEPEAHLHGNLQIRFLKLLKQMQQKLGIQIILSTHSERMIRATDLESVIPLSAAAATNRGLTGSEELQELLTEQLDAYEIGKAKICGRLIFFEGRMQKQFERTADVLGVDCFTALKTSAFIRGWQKYDDLPFDAAQALRSMPGRTIEVMAVYDSDKASGSEAAMLEEAAKRSGVQMRAFSGSELRQLVRLLEAQRDLSEEFVALQGEVREFLEQLRPQREVRVSESDGQEQVFVRREYEQLSFFDIT